MPKTTFFSLKLRDTQFKVAGTVQYSTGYSKQLKEDTNLLHQACTRSPQDHALPEICFLHDALMGTDLISDRFCTSKARRSCQTHTQQTKASSVTP